MQGAISSFDPHTREGIIKTQEGEFLLASDALDKSIFRFLRQGQRVVFDLNDSGQAINVRTGAEPDMSGDTARV